MKIISKILLFALVCLSIAHAAQAEVFRYFDEEGTLIVTDDPFGTKKRERQFHHREQTTKRKIIPNVREDIDYEFYTVSGNTIRDIVAAIDRLGPFDARDRRRYAGQTRWNFGLSYAMDFSYRLEGDLIVSSVQISNIEFRADITVILPALEEDSSIESPDMMAWEGYLKQLSEHEHDHVMIIQEPRFRQEVIAGISGIRELTLSSSADEDAEAAVRRAIESKVGAVAHDGMKKIKQKNDEYDDLTEHGRKPELRSLFFQRLLE